jgi:hypothetical protein
MKSSIFAVSIFIGGAAFAGAPALAETDPPPSDLIVTQNFNQLDDDTVNGDDDLDADDQGEEADDQGDDNDDQGDDNDDQGGDDGGDEGGDED